MGRAPVGTGSFTREEYWRSFRRIILSADLGAGAACIGWILFWLDHIPDHIFHSHGLTLLLFITSLASATVALVTMIRTKNRLGAPGDRIWHILEVIYAIIASVTGIAAYLINPPV